MTLDLPTLEAVIEVLRKHKLDQDFNGSRAIQELRAMGAAQEMATEMTTPTTTEHTNGKQ